MQSSFKYAKMNNWKIYSEKEINSPTVELERKRRAFWNKKAEQLASTPKTSKLNKTTMAGIIDVSWTLRKTSLIEADVKNVLNQEEVLFGLDGVGRKIGSQKKGTVMKNIDRMSAAHAAVEGNDIKLQELIKRNLDKSSFSKLERIQLTSEYNKKKILFDEAYTELKRAQDATVKALKVKKEEMEKRLRAKTTVLT